MSLGQSFPVTTWGINGTSNTKGLDFYMLELFIQDYSIMYKRLLLNNGLNGYSELALNRYHEVTNLQVQCPD